MIVVDTNILVYLYLSSGWSLQAEQALLKDPFWIGPRLWRSEFRNVLALYIRQYQMSWQDALEIMESVSRWMADREYEVSSAQVLNLVSLNTWSTCSAYDCEFVALAQTLDIPLLTLDKQILREFPQTAMSLDDFVS